MKSIRSITALVIILCTTVSLQAQNRKTVYGNENVVKKDREAGSFEGLSVSSGIDVYLKQGDKEAIVVEADENLHEYILTEIEGGVLQVYTEAGKQTFLHQAQVMPKFM